jgi:Na+-translocating ferredoxin:NAD+ oxidoreductase RNF subunit RnfB
MKEILLPVLWIGGIGGILGIVLAIASKVFAVKVDERIPKITEALPGANCGGCGYTGCAALAEAIVRGEAKPNACVVGGEKCAGEIARVMGVSAAPVVRRRAQVMCSGTRDFAAKKYHYRGAADCAAAARMGGGDKLCPNGCIGLGTCASVCPVNAIRVENGVAAVDYRLCIGCGRCVSACPKHIIRLIPYNAKHWVGCMSVDKGAVTRSYCDVGCISCRLCERSCEAGAITVNDFVASIDYEKCTGCNTCVSKCPRKIIWSCTEQEDGLVITRAQIRAATDLEKEAVSRESK